jgi:DUF4097 and DUF4098 domain-containing protein YvlB
MIRRLSCLVAVVALAACDVSIGNLAGRATEEWTKTYQLAPGGELQIGNTNGRIDIQGVDGNTIDVHAEKIAKATTDEGARELLPRIKINEDVKPDRISIETGKMGGIMLGAGVEVRYTIRAPKNVVVDVTNTNGLITLKGLTGKIKARTTNGGVRGNELAGALEASATNGGVNVDFTSVGRDAISLSTTNGGVSIELPDDAKADVVATCTNGGISVSGIKLEMTEQSRRRVEGKLNGGGAAIDLKTTNGGIRIRGRSERG